MLGKHVTDFLDVRAVLDATAQGWLDSGSSQTVATVLVAERSAFVRAMLRSELEMAGYRVVEADTAEQAIRALADTELDAILAASDLAGDGLRALGDAVRERRSHGKAIRAIGLSRKNRPAFRQASTSAWWLRIARRCSSH